MGNGRGDFVFVLDNPFSCRVLVTQFLHRFRNVYISDNLFHPLAQPQCQPEGQPHNPEKIKPVVD